MSHLTGESRDQGLLFSEPLDALVGRDDPVRVIDAFVDSLDLARLGFAKVEAEATGRPPYAPGDLLKLYVYGYLHRVRSSRRLESEARRNVEVMWLIRRLTPAFKTIADFRKDHAAAIVGVCRSFVGFCRGQALYGGEVVAIDGSKIEAVASRKKVVTPRRIAERMAALDREIAEYLAGLDEADRRERPETLGRPDVAGALAALPGRRQQLQREAEAAVSPVEAPTAEPVAEAQAAEPVAEAPAAEPPAEAQEAEAAKPAAAGVIEGLRAERQRLEGLAQAMAAQGLSQLVLGEEEARLMRTARHGHQVAYNAQSVVDAKHKLIATFDLTNEGNDQRQLHPMAVQGREALQASDLTVVADAGYSSGKQGRLCADAGILAIVPRAATVNATDKRHFSRERFTYDAASDSWRCPAGQTLPCRETSHTEEKKRYWTNACAGCALKPRCTDAAKRTIVRGFYEDDREAMHQRAQSDPAWMALRRATVEHPFGTIKCLMGYPRFLLRGLRKAKAELALMVLSFNLKRVINIMGVQPLLLALRPSPS